MTVTDDIAGRLTEVAHILRFDIRRLYVDPDGQMGEIVLQQSPPIFPKCGYDLQIRYSGDEWGIRCPYSRDWYPSDPRSRGARGTELPVGDIARLPAESDLSTVAREAWSVVREGEIHARFGSLRAVTPADWITVAAAAVATTVIVPFMQVLISKAAEDAYAAMRKVLRRGTVRPANESAEATPNAAREVRARAVDPSAAALVAIRDPETGTQLILPEAIPDTAITRLVELDPDNIRGKTIVWNEASRDWHVAQRREMGNE